MGKCSKWFKKNKNEKPTGDLETAVEISGRGLIPLLLFVLLFVIVGCVLDLTKGHIHSIQNAMGFYLIFSPIFTIIPIVVGFMIIPGTLNNKLKVFLKGAANENILIMILIYLLSGMFSNLMSTIGASSAVAFLGFKIISPTILVGGIFIISSILSTAMGTSVGTIVAFGPIVFAMAKYSDVNPAMIGGALLCGAMFGDDLSMVSDTAIASCRTQRVTPKERFVFNLKLLIFPAIIAIILFFTLGYSHSAHAKTDNWIWWQALITIIPFILVLVLALCEINVFLVLLIGVVSALIVGFALHHIGHWSINGALSTNYVPNATVAHFDNHNAFDPQGKFTDTSLDIFLVGMDSLKQGMLGMGEIIFLALLTGGLSGLCTYTRGMEWLMKHLSKKIRGKKSAELSIATLTSFTDICLANNTIAIILSGDMVYEIGQKYNLNKNKVATFTSVFPAVFQGLIPYGAQMLMIISLANPNLGSHPISFVGVWEYSWYLYLLFVTSLLAIFVPQVENYLNFQFGSWIKKMIKKDSKIGISKEE